MLSAYKELKFQIANLPHMNKPSLEAIKEKPSC